MPSPQVPEIDVHELKSARDRGEAPYLLDVRREDEYEAANLGGELIPLHELPQRIDELSGHRDERVVVHCRSGARSAQAVAYLREHGYDAVNLKGGILAWKNEIDGSLQIQ